MVKVSRTCLQLVNALSEKCDHNLVSKIQDECLRKDGRRIGPVTEKQLAWRERFKTFARECKGTPDYRTCMKKKLRG